MSDQPTGRVEEGSEERGFGQAVTLGIILGIPALFLISFLLALPGAGVKSAAAIATVPAMFGGPLFGGFAMVLRWVVQQEKIAEADRPKPAARPSDEKLAA